MNKLEFIKEQAFIDELKKIASQCDYKNIFEFIKESAFIDEMKKIANYGVGNTLINEFVKTADNYYKPDKWVGRSGVHKAIAEDPKDYYSAQLKGNLFSAIPIVPSWVGRNLMLRNEQNKVKDSILTDLESEIVKNKAIKKVNKVFIPLTIASMIGGSMLGSKLVGDKYLKERGIQKDILGRYSFNPEAKEKYLQGEAMTNPEQIKTSSINNEIEKDAAAISSLPAGAVKAIAKFPGQGMKGAVNLNKLTKISKPPEEELQILRPGSGFVPMSKVSEYLKEVEYQAYKDELEKIALRNPVAQYAMKGSTIGAGVGGGGSALLAMKLLKKAGPKVSKSPIVALATVAGAIAGAKAGGNIGAYMGGGVKGTYGLDQPYPTH